MRRATLTAFVAVLAVLAGCASPVAQSPGGDPGPSPTTGTTTAETGTATTTDPGADPGTTPRPDPDTDRLGWEAGYWYDESIAVTPGDGYNSTEIERVLARTMARVEVIREREFQQTVSTEVITREEYQNRNVFEFRENPLDDQVWEALFLVGEDQSAADALESVYGGSVSGYYSSGQIVLVSDSDEGVELDVATLAHELVHALQDQYGAPYPGGQFTDEVLATRSLAEGEANYVMDRYTERCEGEGEWSCLPTATSGGSNPQNVGLYLTLFVPYSDGPTLVEELVARDGWAAVTAAEGQPPASTEQVIHPEKYPDERPRVVEIEDRSDRVWTQLEPGGRTNDRVGEAALYAMFWENGIIEQSHLRTDERRYNYSHPITAGWAGDSVEAYQRGDQFAYVFKTAWDTPKDARQFHEAYLDLLESKGAQQVRESVYRIPNGTFADAFRVERRGDVVLVVNAPTVGFLSGVHAPRGVRSNQSDR